MLPLKERIAARADRKAEQLAKSDKKMDKKAFIAASDATAPGYGGNPAAWSGSSEASGNGAGTDKTKAK